MRLRDAIGSGDVASSGCIADGWMGALIRCRDVLKLCVPAPDLSVHCCSSGCNTYTESRHDIANAVIYLQVCHD
eukprot:758045-Hanusia_phi.AAC.1